VNIKSSYLKRSTDFKTEAQTQKQRYNRFSYVRLLLFVAAFALAFLVWSASPLLGILFILLFLIGFYRFILWHQAILKNSKHLKELSRINQLEAGVLDHEYYAFDNGSEFVDPDHSYSFDLDIFGDYSFFQYANRCSTAIGRRRLAEYLQNGAGMETIKKRQKAVAELKDRLDWRQDFQALGREVKDDLLHLKALTRWLSAPAFVQNNKWLRIALWFVPLWMLAGLLLFIFYLPWQVLLFFLILPAIIIQRTLKQVNETHEQTAHAEKILARYAVLCGHIEPETFQSDKLKNLKAIFGNGDTLASKKIKRLSYIIAQLNVRFNMFAVFLNIGGLWDLHWVYRLEKWKAEQNEQLPQWFDALSEFEALSSLGNMYYNNPGWVFPHIHEQTEIKGEQLGHPLIPTQKSVSNDAHFPGSGHIKLVTGSNMAGKSTYLRTVGINIVLANAGAPVCAKQFSLPLLQVYTSMRTQDALHESTSSFFAELKRLKFIIEAVEEKQNIFFLLDEILKGTNSNDRHTGSKALIRQLIKSEGTGVIATHDLELGKLEATSGGAIENLCMEVEIKDGELFFDYKIKKGVSVSFNATLLMKNMGIKVEG